MKQTKQLKPEKYGAWTIYIRKTGNLYEYRVELHGTDVSHGWISVPYGATKNVAIVYAKEGIEQTFKRRVLIDEYGTVRTGRF